MLARPGLPEFEYIKAESPQEVFRLLEKEGDNIKILSGGTDLFIQMRDHSEGPDILLDVKSLPGMGEITYKKKEGLTIGAAATLNQISSHPDIQTVYPVLAQSADTVGNYQLRNRATMGGNLCNASPSADMAPAALVYECITNLLGPNGERELKLADFFQGPGKTALESTEYLTSLHFPNPPDGAVGRYLKLGRSKKGDLAIVGVAVLGYKDPEVESGFQFRIGVNSTAPTPYRVPQAEALLAKNKIKEEIIGQAAEKAMIRSAPIEDVRATALYQKEMVRNLTSKALSEVWDLLKKS
jgi:carbon-monoxide dehydrogenase medium subunit